MRTVINLHHCYHPFASKESVLKFNQQLSRHSGITVFNEELFFVGVKRSNQKKEAPRAYNRLSAEMLKVKTAILGKSRNFNSYDHLALEKFDHSLTVYFFPDKTVKNVELRTYHDTPVTVHNLLPMPKNSTYWPNLVKSKTQKGDNKTFVQLKYNPDQEKPVFDVITEFHKQLSALQ